MIRILPWLATVHIPKASASWGLLCQSGLLVPCTVGIPLDQILHGLFDPKAMATIDVFIMDGHPVDSLQTTIVPDGAHIALAAGLPGIAGLAMKSNSPVRALRGGISHTAEHPQKPEAGTIRLALYSLALPLFSACLLAQGVGALPAQIHRYALMAPDDTCIFNEEHIYAKELAQKLQSLPPAVPLGVFATIPG